MLLRIESCHLVMWSHEIAGLGMGSCHGPERAAFAVVQDRQGVPTCGFVKAYDGLGLWATARERESTADPVSPTGEPN
ncbi:hypothetical protein GCM10023159_16280 [Brevibacterium yomogidense]